MVRIGTQVLVGLSVVGVLAGCSDEVGPAEPGLDGSNVERSSDGGRRDGPPPDARDAEELEDAPEDCAPRYPPACVAQCSDDVLFDASCVDGDWRCPSGMKLESECSSDTCIGPRPGPSCVESCSDSSLERPVCISRATGFGCPDGTFAKRSHCSREGCKATTTAEGIDGIRVEFPTRCQWTVSQVRETVRFRYEIVVDEQIDGVTPLRPEGTTCHEPEGFGLVLGKKIHGNGQSYCRCDRGNCADQPLPETSISPGRFEGYIEWSGRNFDGPSDTGATPGEYFPPGTYELKLWTRGRIDKNGRSEPFTVEGTAQIEIVPDDVWGD